MESFYLNKTLMELRTIIDQLHFTYLNTREIKGKKGTRTELEGCIKDYLCLASHNQKFILSETAIVLKRSTRQEFSGYQAAIGWNALQLYAGNLFSQPWRKEYRKILKYSGFYMHQIKANLNNADLMFEALGYKAVGVSNLILHGPICPDRVVSVSRDCLVAYVECQIFNAIWEELTPTLAISWHEIVVFRSTHTCSPEQSVTALRNQHKRYQDVLNRTYPQEMSSSTNFLLSQFSPTLTNINNYHLLSNDLPPAPDIYCQHVPTAQPLKLQPPTDGSGGLDTCQNVHIPTNGEESNRNVPHKEDCGFVKKKLESRGRNKHLGEQSNLLTLNNKYKGKCNKGVAEKKSISMEEVNNLAPINSTTHTYLAANQNKLQKSNSQTIIQKKLSPTKSCESLSARETSRKSPSCKNIHVACQKFPAQDGIAVQQNKKSPAKYTRSIKIDDIPDFTPPLTLDTFNSTTKSTSAVQNVKKTTTAPPPPAIVVEEFNNAFNMIWQCSSCTYLNNLTNDICEICNKTRNEDDSMKGLQCVRCTLVNSKNVEICEACGFDLK